ncbi:hypothetical protein P9272_13640 [Mesorhizobium sp. WSM4976]|uniref:hypothetical protein n=1 Tax=Mesorhizobium sp. WSM4976 TaxID=3038549 RepID=UPI002416D496|nr:hypothetical protein [Mesorhizobium sp. WSM4976]MDG4894615.1 hypothetical protein [Mesorhizobium sp. WSM4976]
MAPTPFILPREKRESAILVGNGTAGPYAASLYKVFDTADVAVFAKAAGETVYTDVTASCTIAKVNPAAAYDYFTVTFGAAVPASTSWYHQARRTAQRSVAVTKAGTINSLELEKELSKQASAQSELRRDVDRAVRVMPGVDPVTIIPGADGELAKFENGDVVPSGENVEAIIGATAAAVAARDAARKWATEAEDVGVDDGVNPAGFSAFNWMRKALGYATAAAASAAAAAASAAGVNLPPIAANTFLQAKPDATGYATKTTTEVRNALAAAAFVVDRVAVKALDPIKEKAATIYGEGLGRNGTWVAYLTSGLSAADQAAAGADALEGRFFRSTANPLYTWARHFSGAVDLRWWGAVADGDIANAAANASALNAALGTGKKVSIPYSAAGYHFGTNQITVASGQFIEGESKVLLKSTAATSLFKLTGTTTAYSGISNVAIDMAGAGGSSTAIRFATATASVARVRLGAIKFTNCVEAIGDEVHASNFISDVLVEDVLCQQTLGRQVYNRRSNGFIVFRDFIIDHTQNPALVSFESARFENFAGLELARFDALGYGTGAPAYNAGAPAIVLAGNGATGVALWLDRVFADTVIGDGILVQNSQYVFATAIESSLARGHALTLNNVVNAVLSNPIANGATGQTGAAAGADGLRVLNSSDVTISNLLAVNNTGSGLNISMTNRSVTTGLVSKANTFGLAIQGAAGSNIVSGGTISGNATPVSNTATGGNNVIKDIAGYNPVGAAALAPAASPWTYTAGSSPETLYFSAATSVTAVTQSAGVSILPAALGANVPFAAQLGPNEAIVITYTGALTAKKMVH